MTVTDDEIDFEAKAAARYLNEYTLLIHQCDPILNTQTNTLTNYIARLIQSTCHATQPVLYSQTRHTASVLRFLTNMVEDCIRIHEIDQAPELLPPTIVSAMVSPQELGLQIIHELTASDSRVRLNHQRRIDLLNSIVRQYGGMQQVLLAKIGILAYELHRKYFKHLHNQSRFEVERREDKIVKMMSILKPIVEKSGALSALDAAYMRISEDFGTGPLCLQKTVFTQIV